MVLCGAGVDIVGEGEVGYIFVGSWSQSPGVGFSVL